MATGYDYDYYYYYCYYCYDCYYYYYYCYCFCCCYCYCYSYCTTTTTTTTMHGTCINNPLMMAINGMDSFQVLRLTVTARRVQAGAAQGLNGLSQSGYGSNR